MVGLSHLDMQEQHQLTNTEISDYKELFMLYDKDEDGVLSFTQLCLAFRTLGVRIQGENIYRIQGENK